MVQAIVTHPGEAHRDEFSAICILLAHFWNQGQRPPVIRINPTPEYTANPEVWVLDIGGEHNPALNVYDHHQLPGDGEPTCTLSLILEKLGVLDAAKAASAWVEFTEWLDSKGPTQTMNAWEISSEGMQASQSGIEAQILQMFSSMSVLFSDEPLYQIMTRIGRGWLKYWQRFSESLDQLTAKSGEPGNTFITLPEGGYRENAMAVKLPMKVLHFDWPAGTYVLGALEEYIQQHEEQNKCMVVGTITRDNRGPGWRLYRRNDNPFVDFRKLALAPGVSGKVTFIHNNGFIAVTVDMGVMDLLELFKMATYRIIVQAEWPV